MSSSPTDPTRPGPVERLASAGHEQLLVSRGRRTGAHTIVAVHSTALGPALGGCRVWRYPDLGAAVDDALRLSAAMTLKAAVAGLPLGGGKAVVRLPNGPGPEPGVEREALLRDLADAVNLLGGRYITAEDVGTTSADMAFLAGFTDHVVGRPAAGGGSGDPGEFTAAGVLAAMRACAEAVYGVPDLAGRSVAIVGLGSVGADLARRLGAAGADLRLCDVDQAKRALAGELGAAWIEDPAGAHAAEVDILAPCALGGLLDARRVEELRCRIVCGAANNQLDDDARADRLAARGILYAPDFIVNAGGLINVALELTGYDLGLATRRAADIEGVLGRVLLRAREAGQTPLAAARELAADRLAAPGLRRAGGPGVRLGPDAASSELYAQSSSTA
ncbi:MAG: leucine dehydrogenase [Solirubrobacteraceae bacterium]|nr:leucine dehydrogenase [Solirubrobacteraceae bacterium]